MSLTMFSELCQYSAWFQLYVLESTNNLPYTIIEQESSEDNLTKQMHRVKLIHRSFDQCGQEHEEIGSRIEVYYSISEA